MFPSEAIRPTTLKQAQSWVLAPIFGIEALGKKVLRERLLIDIILQNRNFPIHFYVKNIAVNLCYSANLAHFFSKDLKLQMYVLHTGEVLQ